MRVDGAGAAVGGAHLGPQYRQVVRTLAWQRRTTGLAVEADRPGYVLEMLGSVPASTRGWRVWRHAAAETSSTGASTRSRIRTGRSAPSPTTSARGPPTSGSVRPSSAPRPSNGPAAAAPTSASRPANAPASRDLASNVAGQARSGPPASTTRKEHPNGLFATAALRRR